MGEGGDAVGGDNGVRAGGVPAYTNELDGSWKVGRREMA